MNSDKLAKILNDKINSGKLILVSSENEHFALSNAVSILDSADDEELMLECIPIQEYYDKFQELKGDYPPYSNL